MPQCETIDVAEKYILFRSLTPCERLKFIFELNLTFGPICSILGDLVCVITHDHHQYNAIIQIQYISLVCFAYVMGFLLLKNWRLRNSGSIYSCQRLLWTCFSLGGTTLWLVAFTIAMSKS